MVLSTDGYAPEDRLDAWRALCGDISEVGVSSDASSAFRAHKTCRRIGPFLLSHLSSSGLRFERTRMHRARDDLDHWMLLLCLSGGRRSRIDDIRVEATAGDLILKSFAIDYEEDIGPGEWLQLVFPRATWPNLSAGLASRPLGPVRGPGANLLGDYLRFLSHHPSHLGEVGHGALAEATRAIIAACLLDPSLEDTRRPRAIAGILEARVERVIRENLSSARLDTRRICELAGVSRSTLYRMFEGRGGVAAHVRRLRLEAVHADLSDPEQAGEPIAGIAERNGMHCTTSFNRAFRRKFGCTPGEVRETALAAAPPPRPNRRPAVPTSFRELLP